ncbi:MAG: hypothetical protein KH366_10955, partial [Clostridiaceae bacterium]|nr:hypothetical protein [Clostridiaceae bacterium]
MAVIDIAGLQQEYSDMVEVIHILQAVSAAFSYEDSGVKRSKTFDINLYLENLTRYLSFTSV